MPLPPGISEQATVPAAQGSNKVNLRLDQIASLATVTTAGWSGSFQAQVGVGEDQYYATFTVVDGLITSVELGEPIIV